MGKVKPRRRRSDMSQCCACGSEADHVMKFSGLVDSSVAMCTKCGDVALSEFELLRRDFEVLVAGGMSRAQANQMMIQRISGEAGS